MSERFADGLASVADLKAAQRRTRGCERETCWPEAVRAAVSTSFAAANEVRSVVLAPHAHWWIHLAFDDGDTAPSWSASANRVAEEQEIGQAALLRDLVGPLPFRPLPQVRPGWLAWEGGTVPKLATAVYEERAFDRLPVMADALEEAGCAEAELLAHLRGPGPHARGCWALDLLLGKG